ncbi:glycosyltransferase family 4 protein [bacterium]|nr:glycosyltransferase family 4 protein [candidate division CSSED10-310 bacterium]
MNRDLSGPYKIAMVAACPFPAAFASSGLIRELSLELSRRGHEIHVITYHLGLRDYHVDGLRIHRIPGVPFYRKISSGISPGKPICDALLCWKLLNVLRSTDIDVIHAHNYEAPVAGYFARYFSQVPVLYHAHNTMLHELPSYFRNPLAKRAARAAGRKLDLWIPSRADRIIALSAEQYQYLLDTGIPGWKIHLIPPAIDPDSFLKGNGRLIRDRFHLIGEPLIVYTGGLQPYQNCDALIKTMKFLHRNVPDAHLLIVARSAPESLRSLAHQAGISDRIHFLQRTGLEWDRHSLAAADVAVIPRTQCIGFPIKILNYLAASKPVVCFEDLAKSFISGRELLAVPTGDYDAMSDAIRQIIQNPELAAGLSRNGFEAVTERHGWSTMIPKIERLYRELIPMQARFVNSQSDSASHSEFPPVSPRSSSRVSTR